MHMTLAKQISYIQHYIIATWNFINGLNGPIYEHLWSRSWWWIHRPLKLDRFYITAVCLIVVSITKPKASSALAQWASAEGNESRSRVWPKDMSVGDEGDIQWFWTDCQQIRPSSHNKCPTDLHETIRGSVSA